MPEVSRDRMKRCLRHSSWMNIAVRLACLGLGVELELGIALGLSKFDAVPGTAIRGMGRLGAEGLGFDSSELLEDDIDIASMSICNGTSQGQ